MCHFIHNKNFDMKCYKHDTPALPEGHKGTDKNTIRTKFV